MSPPPSLPQKTPPQVSNLEKDYDQNAKEKEAKSVLHGAEVLTRLFENGKSPLSLQFLRWRLWKKWDDFVGAQIASLCEPVSYFHGKLFLFVKSSTLMHHLVFLKESIRLKINEKLEFEYITEIVFTMDPKFVPKDQGERDHVKKSIGKLTQQP